MVVCCFLLFLISTFIFCGCTLVVYFVYNFLKLHMFLLSILLYQKVAGYFSPEEKTEKNDRESCEGRRICCTHTHTYTHHTQFILFLYAISWIQFELRLATESTLIHNELHSHLVFRSLDFCLKIKAHLLKLKTFL